MGNSAAGGRSPLGLFLGQPTPRLYDCVVEALRSRHYSRRTEEAYLHWIRRFLAFHNSTHPRQFAEKDLNRFLTHLAIRENVAAHRTRRWQRFFSFTTTSWNNPWIESKGWCGRASRSGCR